MINSAERASKIALRQTHFDDLMDRVEENALSSFQSQVADDMVDAMIRQAQLDIESPVEFDPLRRRAMRLRALGAVRAHAEKTIDALKSSWDPDKGLEAFSAKPHYNRAAFYAQDQAGFNFGRAQKELAEKGGAIGYIWLRTTADHPRERHLNRVGRFYRFGEVSDEPGVLYNCQCSMKPVYDPKDIPNG